ncbi:hypothetical protein EVA_22404, partial [gut metagenome]
LKESVAVIINYRWNNVVPTKTITV